MRSTKSAACPSIWRRPISCRSRSRPFQWEAQITPEEYLRRVHLLQENIHSRSIDYRYHESNLSQLEAVLARGDRRLGPVLLAAQRLGCKLDGWDEYFRYDLWMQAFREVGVDPVFYTTRGFGEDEILPWSTISVGVSDGFFRREREKAYRSEVTPDCRTKCAGCGARRLSEEGNAMNRLLFEKDRRCGLSLASRPDAHFPARVPPRGHSDLALAGLQSAGLRVHRAAAVGRRGEPVRDPGF